MERGRKKGEGEGSVFTSCIYKCFLSLLKKKKKKTLEFDHMDKVLLLFKILKRLVFSRKFSVTAIMCISLAAKWILIFQHFMDLGCLVSIPLSRVFGEAETS